MTHSPKIWVIGGSAGSLSFLMDFLPKISQSCTYAIVVVLHRKNSEDTTLEKLIATKASLPVQEIEDKTALLPGFIHVAPSDYHVLFEKNGIISLDSSDRVNYSRPSIDVSFESAADAYGSAATGVLLSGANADGTNGLIAIKNMGGLCIVQHPHTAEVPFMPLNAIQNVHIDHVFTVDEMLNYINQPIISSLAHPQRQ